MFQGVENTTGNNDVDLILALHRFKRPKDSKSEKAFIASFLAPLDMTVDSHGNIHKEIPGPKGPSKVLWSCHTDTVHTTEGMQRVSLEGKTLSIHKKELQSNCLGSDDAAGVYVMLRMIMANVPGHYIFHFGEEKGCVGSRGIADKDQDFLSRFDYAIAFDRRGTDSIVTHMGNTRTCSDAFARTIKEMLPESNKLDDTGRSTDTKQYEKLIAECTNISVGYTCEHTRGETQNVAYLLALTEKMIKFDESKLKVHRDKSVVDSKWASSGGNWGGTYSSGNVSYTPTTMADLIKRNSDVLATAFSDAGISFDTLVRIVLSHQKNRTYFTYDTPKLIPPHWMLRRWEEAVELEKKTAELKKAREERAFEAEKAFKSRTTVNGEIPSRGGGAPSTARDLVETDRGRAIIRPTDHRADPHHAGSASTK